MRRTAKLDKWISELRSGRYTQGHGLLHRVMHGEPQHCCLGVARVGVFHGDCAYDLELRPDELNELGMGRSDQSACVKMNDQLAMSFTEIADVLQDAADREVSVESALHRWIIAMPGSVLHVRRPLAMYVFELAKERIE